MKKVEYIGDVKDFVDNYDKVNYKIWNSKVGDIVAVRKYIREHYLKEQSFCCAYCRIEKKESHGGTWDVEHVLSKAKYPEFLLKEENLAVACKECNGPKDEINILVSAKKLKGQFPNSSDDYTIVHPHFDVHSEHFEIIIFQKRRSIRVRNSHKARTTYLACNFVRFDYQFCEWDCYDSAMVEEMSAFLDNCPSDATPGEIKRMLGHLKFVKKVDF